MQQLPLPVRLRTSSVFESYFAGPNAAAIAELRGAWRSHSPLLWLYGPSGVGKTHLLQALCARAAEQARTAAYLPMLELGAAGADMLAGCEQLAWVCIDDAQSAFGDARWERELFRLYTELDANNGRLVIAADRPPVHVTVNLRDLASRLGGGTVLRLQALDEETQIAALQLRAAQRGLELPNEVAVYLMRHLPRDMHTLCDFLDRMDVASLAARRRLTVPFVKEVLDASRGTSASSA